MSKEDLKKLCRNILLMSRLKIYIMRHHPAFKLSLGRSFLAFEDGSKPEYSKIVRTLYCRQFVLQKSNNLSLIGQCDNIMAKIDNIFESLTQMDQYSEHDQQLYLSMNKLTKKSKKHNNGHRNRGIYNKISLELRTQLIEMVTKDGLTIYRASKLLSINNSTAKVIIRNFRKRGHVYSRKSERNNENSFVNQEVRSAKLEQREEILSLQASPLACPFQGYPLLNPEFEVPFHFGTNACFPVYYYTPTHAYGFS